MRSVADNSLHGGSQTGPGGASRFKVKFGVKLMLFSFSVLALSWFFEGSRQIRESVDFSSVGYLSAGIVLTLALLIVQAFLIYAEERSKGTRTRNIPFFGKLYDRYVAAKLEAQSSGQNIHVIEGDKTNRG